MVQRGKNDEKLQDYLKKEVAKKICNLKADSEVRRICEQCIEVGEMVDLPTSDEFTYAGSMFKYNSEDNSIGKGTLTCLVKAEVNLGVSPPPEIKGEDLHDMHFGVTCAFNIHCVYSHAAKQETSKDACNDEKVACTPDQDILKSATNNESLKETSCEAETPRIPHSHFESPSTTQGTFTVEDDQNP